MRPCDGSAPYVFIETGRDRVRTPMSCRTKLSGSNSGCGNEVARTHSGVELRAADHAAYLAALLRKVLLASRTSKFGTSAKLIQTSLPPEPLPPPAVVE